MASLAADASVSRPIRRRVAVDGRVRSGCLTCKARKKKCDGQVASTEKRCRACIRLGLVCEQVPLRRIPPRPRRRVCSSLQENVQSPADYGSDTTAQPLTPDGMPYADQGSPPSASLAEAAAGSPSNEALTSTQRLLFQYFLENVAPLCTIIQSGASSVCSVLLPMAIVDSSLLHALLIYSSAHFNAGEPSLPTSPQVQLQFESAVARGLSSAINQNAVKDTTIACALMASTAQVVRGDTSHWLLHHQGAGHLVKHLGPKRLLETTDGIFLLRYFVYHDIMAALGTGQRPSIEGVYWTKDTEAPAGCADPCTGLAHPLFKHITEICSFMADTADLGPSSDCHDLSRATLRAEIIAQAMRAETLEPEEEPTDVSTLALVHHAEAVRFAALFHLYRRLFQCGISFIYESHMDECVQKIIRHVSLVPVNLYCEMGLLFPLFMAGVGCKKDKDIIEYIKSRFKYIEKWTRFRHVTRARELLQMLWDQDRTDWEVMLQELGWCLSLA